MLWLFIGLNIFQPHLQAFQIYEKIIIFAINLSIGRTYSWENLLNSVVNDDHVWALKMFDSQIWMESYTSIYFDDEIIEFWMIC